MQLKAILVVDDEPRSRSGLKRMLERWGAGRYDILTAADGREAMTLLRREPVRLLITDIRMPEINGLHLADTLNEGSEGEKPAVILVSGYAEFEYAQRAIQLGVTDYLLKPIGRDKLIAAVERALETAEERTRFGKMQRIVDPELMQAGERLQPVSDSVKDAARFIDERLAEPFTLRDVARHVHLNPSYLSVLFKEQAGLTFSEYVTRRRLQRAKEMLLHTKLPIAEIAERVGYQSPKYFGRIFKQYEGDTPGHYRSGEADAESE